MILHVLHYFFLIFTRNNHVFSSQPTNSKEVRSILERTRWPSVWSSQPTSNAASWDEAIGHSAVQFATAMAEVDGWRLMLGWCWCIYIANVGLHALLIFIHCWSSDDFLMIFFVNFDVFPTRYPAGMYTCLSGFVDMCEPVEEAFKREAFEEAKRTDESENAFEWSNTSK